MRRSSRRGRAWPWSPAIGSGVAAVDGRLCRRAAANGTLRRRAQAIRRRWTMETVCDGHSIRPVGTWQELCWQSDKKCDFLELGIELGEGLQLERQIVLSKRDNVLVMADIVSSKDRTRSTSCGIRSACRWPAAWPGFRKPKLATACCSPASSGRRCCRWGCRNGAAIRAAARWLAKTAGSILARSHSGRSLYCGLLFDLDPQRVRRSAAPGGSSPSPESLEAVPRDVAVGFRAQSGDEQWLVYRSLGPAGNRAVLGQNISVRVLRRPIPSRRRPRRRVDRDRGRVELAGMSCRLPTTCGACASGSPRRPRRRAAVPSEITLVGVTKYVGLARSGRTGRRRLHRSGRKPPARTVDESRANSLSRASPAAQSVGTSSAICSATNFAARCRWCR